MSPARKSAAFPPVDTGLRRQWDAAPLTKGDGIEMLDRAIMWLARWAIEEKWAVAPENLETSDYLDLIDSALELSWLRHAGRTGPLRYGLGCKNGLRGGE